MPLQISEAVFIAVPSHVRRCYNVASPTNNPPVPPTQNNLKVSITCYSRAFPTRLVLDSIKYHTV